MADPRERAARNAAMSRAVEYRAQAAAFRNLADAEPLAEKRRLLELSASKYDQLALAEERLANGRSRYYRETLVGRESRL